MNFMGDIISLIIALICCFVVYKIFESRGFKEALIFRIVFQLVVNLIDGTLIANYNSGISFFLLMIGIMLVVNLIITGIEYFVYNKTNSFLSFIIWSALAEYLISIAFAFALVFLASIF